MADMKNWVKAGLIGAAAVAVLQIVGMIPWVGCFTSILAWVAYGCAGALAVYWMPPERLPGVAAQHGALAGAIAGAIGGLVALLIPIGTGTTVFAPLVLLAEAAGFDPAALIEMGVSLVGGVVCGTGCYAVGVAIVAGFGALGAVIFAATQAE